MAPEADMEPDHCTTMLMGSCSARSATPPPLPPALAATLQVPLLPPVPNYSDYRRRLGC